MFLVCLSQRPINTYSVSVIIVSSQNRNSVYFRELNVSPSGADMDEDDLLAELEAMEQEEMDEQVYVLCLCHSYVKSVVTIVTVYGDVTMFVVTMATVYVVAHN